MEQIEIEPNTVYFAYNLSQLLKSLLFLLKVWEQPT